MENVVNSDKMKIKYALIEAAEDPGTSPETLDEIAKYQDSDVKVAVAKNPNTSPETLDWLAKNQDSDSNVKLAVAENHKTPLQTLQELKDKDKDPKVREAATKTYHEVLTENIRYT